MKSQTKKCHEALIFMHEASNKWYKIFLETYKE